MDGNAKECPHCGADLKAGQIPQRYVDEGLYGPPTTEPKFYYRTLGVVHQGVYDGVLYWQCPDCLGTWHRWPEGTYQRQRAEKFIHA